MGLTIITAVAAIIGWKIGDLIHRKYPVEYLQPRNKNNKKQTRRTL